MSDEERTVNPDEIPEVPTPEVPFEPPAEKISDAMEEIEESVTEEPIEFSLPAGPAEPSAGAEETMESTDDDRLMAALAWFSMVILQLPIISVILMMVEPNKDRPFQRHHSVTSTVFYVAAFIYEILAVIVFAILATISLGCLAACLWVIFFVPHALALYYAFQAYSGKTVEIPIISDFARKQNWL